MPYRDALRAARKYRQRLLAGDAKAVREVLRLFAGYHKNIKGYIKELEEEVLRLGYEEAVDRGILRRLDAWRRLDRQLRAEARALIVQWGDYIERIHWDAVLMGLEAAREETLACYRVGDRPAVAGAWHELHTGAVVETLGFFQADSPLTQRLKLFPSVAAEHLKREILQGITYGWNPRKVARRVNKAVGQQMDWVLRWTRTVQLQAYRRATQAAYEENSDIVQSWIWVATLDDRVCASCLAMHGTKHPLNHPLNDHWNGRCVAIPYTRQIGSIRPLRSMPENAEAWLQSQPIEVQQRILGKAGWEAWRRGEVKLRDFTTVVNDPVWGKMRVQKALHLKPPTKPPRRGPTIRRKMANLRGEFLPRIDPLEEEVRQRHQEWSSITYQIDAIYKEAGGPLGITPEQRALIERLKEQRRRVYDQLLQAQNQVNALREEYRWQVYKLLRVKTPSNTRWERMRFVPKGPVSRPRGEPTAEQRRRANEAIRFVNSLVSPETGWPKVNPNVNFDENIRRSFALGRVAHMSPDAEVWALVHELGHLLEDNCPKIQEAALAFYNKRAGDIEPEPLGKHYGPEEKTRRDRFIDPYMGKDYGGKGTELISMGLQFLYQDPDRLALEDPEMFDWLLDLLGGG